MHSVFRTGKGRMSEPDRVQPDNIGFDDAAYHEFLQRQPSGPSPGNMTSQSENIPDFAADPNFKEALEKDKKQTKSDLFILHMKKVTKPDGTCWAVCNYCSKEYKWTKSGGYSTYRKHITTRHPAELAKGNEQSQISSVPQNENVSQTRYSGVLGAGSALLSQKIKRLRGSSSSSSSSVSYDEIKTYHSTNFEFIEDSDVDQFDILHWWRQHQKHFPILSIIVKQILVTPVSTVTVDQEFNAGENILDARRSLLSPESIQVQVCVDDDFKLNFRI
ncbi:hypothetical protein Ddye_010849 [Dipteronia dyeriana]|uniref:HAT C-terminal dimerisation domain-containing protein n=1 Tax=Dipteronia dyeriana TaxID=168575 RepID=A0AAD9XEH5_9ROSI|nr:hypothetical protein Ddye_010849 [Dipteronia dyeriana]